MTYRAYSGRKRERKREKYSSVSMLASRFMMNGTAIPIGVKAGEGVRVELPRIFSQNCVTEADQWVHLAQGCLP